MEIRYYSNDIEKFITSLDKKSGAGVNKLILFLSKCGNEIQMPYSKPKISKSDLDLARLRKSSLA